MPKPLSLILAATLLPLGLGCEGRAPPGTAPPPRRVVDAPAVRDGAGLLFTFFDRTGQMRTVDRLREIEVEARRAVMITDPRRTLDDDRIFVADLTVHDAREDSYPTWVEQKGTWLDRVMPRVSVATIGPRGESEEPERAPRAEGPRRRSGQRGGGAVGPGRRRAAAADSAPLGAGGEGQAVAGGGGEPSPGALPKVIVFGTSWCPSCRLARQYLTQRSVRFLYLDVEQQPEAGKKMVEIQQANGMRPGTVPLIIVNGRVFQGFSRFQLEVAINNLQQAKAS